MKVIDSFHLIMSAEWVSDLLEEDGGGWNFNSSRGLKHPPACVSFMQCDKTGKFNWAVVLTVWSCNSIMLCYAEQIKLCVCIHSLLLCWKYMIRSLSYPLLLICSPGQMFCNISFARWSSLYTRRNMFCHNAYFQDSCGFMTQPWHLSSAGYN